MKRITRATTAAILAGVLSVSLAACGDDDDLPETETEVEIPGVDEPELEVD